MATPTLPESSFSQIASSIKFTLESQLEALQAFLLKQISSFEKELHPYLHDCIDAKGKCLRASLLFLSAGASTPKMQPNLVKAAAIIEMIHQATLVHDDILDEAKIRRGRPTLSSTAGSVVAVLFGDALFAHALTLASEYPTTEVCQIVAQATKDVCSGEIMQTLHRDGENIGKPKYQQIIDLKTAKLFAASTQLGALLGGHPPAFIDAAKDFGRCLGLAYQIYDDALDYWADELKTGKTLGTDLDSGKVTLPLLLLLETLDPQTGKALLNKIQTHEMKLSELCKLFEANAIRQATKAHFDLALEEAKSKLSPHAHLSSAPMLTAVLKQIQHLWTAAGM